MTDDMRNEAASLSSKRARLASFAYRLACRRAQDRAESQLIIATGNPLQPYVSSMPPR